MRSSLAGCAAAALGGTPVGSSAATRAPLADVEMGMARREREGTSASEAAGAERRTRAAERHEGRTLEAEAHKTAHSQR